MNKYLILLFVGLHLVLQIQSQTMRFSAPNGKQGKLEVKSSDISNNEITLVLQVQWLDKKLKPTEDLESQIVFNKNDVSFGETNSIISKTFDETSNSKFYFNSSLSLTFILTEDTKLIENNLVIKFPFKFAENLQTAVDESKWKNFIITSPRDFAAKCFVDPAAVKDIIAPKIEVLNPEGVMDGFKPTIYTEEMEVKVAVSDRNKINEVLVNGTKAIEKEGNTYLAKITFNRMGGTHPVVVSATDASGNKGEYQFFVETRIADAVIAQKPQETEMISDVDTLIPKIGKFYENRFALIIGNEDYKTHQKGLNYESNVEFARRDAEIFKQYAINTLGIKETNIIFMTDAKAVEMHRGVTQLSNLMKATNGEGEAFVYFAGHGFPDEKTKEAYLIPVDVSGNDLEFGIKLRDFYAKLYANPAKNITVFLDACFSGGGREQGLIAARGVRIRPKNEFIKGNLMVFSASSGNESALPYRDKFHGIFTYYLLKALQNSAGDITMQELSDFVTKKVSTACIIHNNKEQTPTVNVSPDLTETWKEIKLNK